MAFADPFEIIKQVQPGLMFYGYGGGNQTDMKLVFLIKEEDKYIKKIGYTPVFQVRVGTFNMDNVVAVCMMVRVNNIEDMTYDCWFNFNTHDGERIFNSIISQDKLIFKFYNSSDCKRTIAINNSLKPYFEVIKDKIKHEWSMQEFDAVKNKIYDMYSPNQLWNTLDFRI